jgi:hypothetical protein
MKDDSIVAVIVIVFLLFGFAIGMSLGLKLQKSDMYARCVEENKTMTYEEVHKMCTDRTK